MKSKKSLSVIAVTAAVLMLAAVLFVGAAGAAENVVTMNGVGYPTFQDAVTAAGNTESTIELLMTTSGGGVIVNPGQNIIFDLMGFTYTVDPNVSPRAAGSEGTKTQAFQLHADSIVTIKNGTLNTIEANKELTAQPKIVWVINSYGTLTLDGVTLDGTNLAHNGNVDNKFVLLVAAGEATLKGDTKIIAPTYTGDDAFCAVGDRWYYNGYSTSCPTLTIVSATITGDIYYGVSDREETETVPEYVVSKGVPTLTITDGNFNGDLIVEDDLKNAATNYFVINSGSFTDLVNVTKYAGNDATIKLLKDVELTDVLEITKPLTLDGNGHTISAKKNAAWPIYTYGTNNEKVSPKNLVIVSGDNVKTEPVTLKNIVFDCSNGSANAAKGVQFYNTGATPTHELINTVIKNSAGYSLNVNGAKVDAKSLTTENSVWFVGIDVELGKLVSGTSVLTIDSLKTINDPIQVSDEGAVKGKEAIVTVTDNDYKEYYLRWIGDDRVVYLNDAGKQALVDKEFIIAEINVTNPSNDVPTLYGLGGTELPTGYQNATVTLLADADFKTVVPTLGIIATLEINLNNHTLTASEIMIKAGTVIIDETAGNKNGVVNGAFDVTDGASLSIKAGKYNKDPKYVATGYLAKQVGNLFEVVKVTQPVIPTEQTVDKTTGNVTIPDTNLDESSKTVVIKDTASGVNVNVTFEEYTVTGTNVNGKVSDVKAIYPESLKASNIPIALELVLDKKILNGSIVLPIIDTTLDKQGFSGAVASITGLPNGDADLTAINKNITNVELTFKSVPTSGYGYRYVVYHVAENGVKTLVKNFGENAGDNLGFTSKLGFSTYVLVKEEEEYYSATSNDGYSVIATESSTYQPDVPDVPDVVPTVEPTQGVPAAPTADPVSPAQPAQASTPAPFIGLLAGLGAAAVLFGLRRK